MFRWPCTLPYIDFTQWYDIIKAASFCFWVWKVTNTNITILFLNIIKEIKLSVWSFFQYRTMPHTFKHTKPKVYSSKSEHIYSFTWWSQRFNKHLWTIFCFVFFLAKMQNNIILHNRASFLQILTQHFIMWALIKTSTLMLETTRFLVEWKYSHQSEHSQPNVQIC